MLLTKHHIELRAQGFALTRNPDNAPTKARPSMMWLRRDAENLYITLSARTRGPQLTIVARASDPESERKIRLGIGIP